MAKVVHYSVLGGTERFAHNLKYDSVHIKNYRPSFEGEKIIILARHFYSSDDIWNVREFIKNNHDNIVGVIVVDDKNFGEDYGDCIPFFSKLNLPIIGLVDRIMNDTILREMEETIDEKL